METHVRIPSSSPELRFRIRILPSYMQPMQSLKNSMGRSMPTVLGKRHIQYEDELTRDGQNYDAWLDYAHLEEGARRASMMRV
jgi:hypothetical protein